MTIEDRVTAVEEFLDWREESGSTGPLADDLTAWEGHLHKTRRDALFSQAYALALAAQADGGDPAALAKFILDNFNG